MAEYEDKDNVARPARVNKERDLITIPNIWRWTVEGKVFEAGYGLEDSAITSEGAINDLNVGYSLQAPSSSELLVIPIMLKICIVADGSSLTTFQVLFTKPAGLCATPMVLSAGTALTSKHALYRSNPAKTAQQSTTLSALTSTALLAADYVSYHRGLAADALLTTGLATLGDGPSNVQTWSFFRDGVPHVLTSGAAMLVHVNDAATDTTSTCYMQWAEVTEDDLN